MDSLLKVIRSALLNPDQAHVWFRQLHHIDIFKRKDFRITLHEVLDYHGDSVHFKTEYRDFRELSDCLQQRRCNSEGEEPSSSFMFAKIHSLSPSLFLDLLRLFKIDEAALLAFNSGAFHFQHFEQPDSCGSTYALAYNVATMLWSSHQNASEIRAVAIGEQRFPFTDEQIRIFGSDLTHHLAPALLALQGYLEECHGKQRGLVNDMRVVESTTGHRKNDQSPGRFDLSHLRNLDLDNLSQRISNIQYHAISLERTFGCLKSIVQEISELSQGDDVTTSLPQSMKDKKGFRLSLEWRLKSITALREQAQYLLRRVQVQSTVVCIMKISSAHEKLTLVGFQYKSSKRFGAEHQTHKGSTKG
ncbi:hypothetical protein E8E14_005534 [Neopestalotiopsis sp. 37M]|nr:hypothetical protein E8E14_005534 [Neopestalotiopsis sp. 37M]